MKEEKLKFRAGNRRLFPQEELEVWICAFNLLLNNDLPQHLPKIPFAENLITILESERSESRRDPDKLCDLISLIAWIRRFQKSSNSRDEADILDLYFALQIGLDAITQTISELDEKEQKIFMAVKEAGMTEVTVKRVANETRIPYKTCYRYLEKLIDKGFLLKDKIQGRNVYSVFSEKKPRDLIITQGRNFENPELLMKFILDPFQGFSLSHQDTDTTSLVDPITGEKVNVTTGEDEEAVITVENTTHPYPYEKVRSSERSEETLLETEKEPKQLLPSGMISSPKAKNENKVILDIPSEEFSDDKVAVIGDLNPPDQGNCARCHQRKTLPKQAKYSDGTSWASICEDCAGALNEKLRERAPSKLASGDILNLLRNTFPEKFVDVEFSDFIVKHGWTQAEAEVFLKALERHGAIFKVPGGWRWS